MEKKLFLGLFFSFFFVTIIGTLLHELAHYCVAKYLGYDARITYKETVISPPKGQHQLNSVNDIAITMAGTFQTACTGAIGFVYLLLGRRKYLQANKLSKGQWLAIFMSLFWLRPTVNFFIWLFLYFINGKWPMQGDEINMALHYGLPEWTLLFISAMIGIFVLFHITFYVIPKGQRAVFLTAGCFGGIAGYYFWLVEFGKYILP